MYEEIQRLGHIMKPRENNFKKNVEAVQQLEHPTNNTQLKKFLGMLNVYQRFVKDFASIASSLKNTQEYGIQWTLIK